MYVVYSCQCGLLYLTPNHSHTRQREGAFRFDSIDLAIRISQQKTQQTGQGHYVGRLAPGRSVCSR